MAISDITEKIEADAKEYVERILNEAKESAQHVAAETEKLLKEKTATASESIEKTLADNERRVRAKAESEIKHSLEKAKRTELDQVFKDALDTLHTCDDKTYKEILTSLLKDIPKDISGIAYAPPKRMGVTKEILTHAHPKLELKEDDSVLGGLKIQEEHAEYNLTFSQKMADVKKNTEIEVAHLLFQTTS